MRRILFVDDDLPTLESLQLRLRPLRNKWAMTFVESGPRASGGAGENTSRSDRERHADARHGRGGAAADRA